MYINGQRRFRAQTPDRGDFFRVNNASETIMEESGGRRALLASQKIKPRPADAGFLLDASKTDVNDVLTVFYHKWDNTRKRILEINLADSSFFTVGIGMKPCNRIDSSSRYVVENYREALDNPGEWYLSKDGYLYYNPMPGETIDNTECMVVGIEKFIVITGDEKTGKNKRVARKIGFTPFDYSKAGVYGDPEWINLAKLDPVLMEEFDKAVAKNSWIRE